MKELFTCLLIIYSLFLTACPKDTAVRKAAKASFEMSGITLDVIKATDKAYSAGIIGIAVKDRMAAAEKKIAIGGKQLNDSLQGYINQTAGNLTVDQLGILNKIFSEQIVAPFLEILEELKVLSPNQADYLHTAITALRAAILVISGTFAGVGFTPDRRLNYV